MLLTERDYRTLALLCRLLAEQNGLPRNFPLLPYLDTNHGDDADAALFRQLILADQTRDAIAQKIGTTRADIEANGTAYTNFYNLHGDRVWGRFFGFDRQNQTVVDTPCSGDFFRTRSSVTTPARARCSTGTVLLGRYGTGGGIRLTPTRWR